MATRTSVRARPVDINRPLTIVRDVSELDTTDGLFVKEEAPAGEATGPVASTSAAPAQPQVPGGAPVGAPPAKKPKPKEIPVPQIGTVPTYTRDYLPTFRIPETYIRGKGGTNYQCDDLVEYDLDNEDEDWLEHFNRHADEARARQNGNHPQAGSKRQGSEPPGSDHRLEDTKFERMLWKLEVAWWEATEPLLGGNDRTNPASLINTGNLQKVHALNILRKAVGGRDVILEAVYQYWVEKRRRWQKPILRRLQAPTNPQDTNPYNVFRPREKANRPLTRRRRETAIECAEKLRYLRENLTKAMQLAELVILRERKKCDLHILDMTVQRCQLNLHHQPPAMHAAVEQHTASRLHEIHRRSEVVDKRIGAYSEIQQAGGAGNLDAATQRALMRRRKDVERDALASLAVASADVLAKVPAPVPAPADEPLWAYTPHLPELIHKAAAAHQPPPCELPPDALSGLQGGAMQAYVGRGGRVALARCNPLTLEPLSSAAESDGADLSNHINNSVLPSHIQPGNTARLSEADQVAFHPYEAAPWALALDINLLPSHIDRAPYLAAHQRWAKLHQGQDRLPPAPPTLAMGATSGAGSRERRAGSAPQVGVLLSGARSTGPSGLRAPAAG